MHSKTLNEVHPEINSMSHSAAVVESSLNRRLDLILRTEKGADFYLEV